MQRIQFLLLLVSFIAGAAAAQPQHGDLVLTASPWNGYQGFTGYVNPAHPGTLTTLVTAPRYSADNWVRMAPGNRDLVVARNSWATQPQPSDLVVVRPDGGQTTLAGFGTVMTHGFELDHDGRWIVATGSYPGNPIRNHLFGVEHATGAVTTYFSLNTTTTFNELVIDRDPGVNLPYTIVTAYPESSIGPLVLSADRSGTVATVEAGSTIRQYFAIELHPRTGDYIVDELPGTIASRTKAWAQTILTFFGGNAIKIGQDDFAWIAYGGSGVPVPPGGMVLKYDLTRNAVVSLFSTGLPLGYYFTGIDVYGSRTLVCNQSASTVAVKVQSRHPLAGGQQYVLAASLGRRPGMGPFPCGDYLDLDTTDHLFWVSALGAWPSVFRNFQGRLDMSGNASARVDIPATLPPNLGVTVFVAGIIFDTAGVIQVTGTHWFVL